jgi:hypothetical protein
MAKLVKAGVTLRDQLNQRFPKRDKRSDGWIGDKFHQAAGRVSDHNPDKDGWVHAIDVDENMGSGEGRKGATAMEFANQLIKYAREGKDGGRLKYVVYENMIASGTHRDKFWVWRKGNWGHTQHIHVSFNDKAENDGSKFDLPIFRDKSTNPQKPQNNAVNPIPFPGNQFVSFGKSNDYVKQMQKKLIAKGYKIPAGATGNYFGQTERAVQQFYRQEVRTTSNGKKMGPKAWNKLFGDK